MPSFFFAEINQKIHQLESQRYHNNSLNKDVHFSQVMRLVHDLECHSEIVLKRIQLELDHQDPIAAATRQNLNNANSLIKQILGDVQSGQFANLLCLDIAIHLRDFMESLPSSSSTLAAHIGKLSAILFFFCIGFMFIASVSAPLILGCGLTISTYLFCNYQADSVKMARTLEEPILGIVANVIELRAFNNVDPSNLYPASHDKFNFAPSGPC